TRFSGVRDGRRTIYSLQGRGIRVQDAITVTISGRNPSELLRTMRELVSEWEGFFRDGQGADQEVPTPEAETVQEAESAPTPEAVAPAEAVYEPPSDFEAKTRDVLAQLAKSGRRDEVVKILAEQGAGATKLKEVPEDRLELVYAAAREA